MATLTIAAHCVDDEFRAELARRGITIIDNRKAPWEWVFEGPRDVLHQALIECWGDLNSPPESYITGD